MRNSTLYRDSVLSEYLIGGEQKYEVTITNGYVHNDSFSDQIVIFRDGDSSNFSDENVIRREWFEEKYRYEDFLEDYGLIHRLQSTYLELLDSLTDELKSENKNHQQLVKLQAQFDELQTKYTQATLLLAEHGIPVNKIKGAKPARPKDSRAKK